MDGNKAARARTALVAAATVMFAKQGFDGPSLDAICQSAGYTRGAFYVHFKTRDDLIAAVVEKHMGGFIDTMIAVGEAGADLEAIVNVFTLAVRDGRFPLPHQVRPHQVLQACGRSPILRAKYVELLSRAKERLAATIGRGQLLGRIRSDLAPLALAQLLLAGVLGVELATELEAPFDAELVAENLMRMIAPVANLADEGA